MPDLSPALRVECAQVFALGFLDFCAGAAVEDDDVIPAKSAEALRDLSMKCIENAQDFISEFYAENPGLVWSTLYAAGQQFSKGIEQAVVPPPIYLN